MQRYWALLLTCLYTYYIIYFNMRTVTFIGLLIIGGALRHMAEMGDIGVQPFLATVLLVAMFMDVAEFYKTMKTK